MALSFNGLTKEITFTTLGTYTDQEIHTAWVDWVLAGNAQWEPAFEPLGGNAISATTNVSPYVLIRNDLGWRLKAPEVSGELFINGNLYPKDPDTAYIVGPTGAYNVQWYLERSSRSTQEVVETGSVTAASVATEILNRALAGHTADDTVGQALGILLANADINTATGVLTLTLPDGTTTVDFALTNDSDGVPTGLNADTNIVTRTKQS